MIGSGQGSSCYIVVAIESPEAGGVVATPEVALFSGTVDDIMQCLNDRSRDFMMPTVRSTFQP